MQTFSTALALFPKASARHWPRLAFYFCGWTLFRLLGVRLFREQVLPLNEFAVTANVEGNCGLNFLHEILIRKTYDFEPLRRSDAGVRVMFDVGANCGFYSLMCCSRDPKLKAVCFEPHPISVSRLQKNVAANRLERQISIVNAAVGANPGECTLEVSRDSSMAVVSTSSFRLFETSSKVEVKLVSLDDFADTAGLFPDLMKIDVEGFEVEVLRGAEKCLQRARYLILECHSPELKAECESLIQDSGFRTTAVGALVFAEKIGEADKPVKTD
jgi:FkbM family methyltransferase